jgi:hypothetical protein
MIRVSPSDHQIESSLVHSKPPKVDHESSRIPSCPSKVTFDSSSSSRLDPLLAAIISTQHDLQHSNTIVRKREVENVGKVLSGCFEVDYRVRVWVKVVNDVRRSAFEPSLL